MSESHYESNNETNNATNRPSLADDIALLAAHIDAATHRLLRLIATFDNRQEWLEYGCLSCAHWLSWRLGWTPATARERLRVAHALEDLPEISAAVATGELSYSKARAVTRVATPASDGEWASTALEATAAQLERIVRCYRRADASEEIARTQSHESRRGLQTFYDDDGMFVVHGRLPPEAGALLQEALAACAPARVNTRDDGRTHEQQQADALADVARAALTGGADSAPCHQVIVHVDAEVLGDPGAAGRSELEAGVALSAETSRRAACDASVIAMTHGARGEVLGVGRKTRVIPTRLRRALRERDRSCRFPGCTHRITDAHHIQHWADGGATGLDNLALLCRRHHTLVHEGGCGMKRGRHGELVFTRASGERLPDVPHSPDVIEHKDEYKDEHKDVVEILADANATAGLSIDALTAYPRWDGEQVDYEWVTAVMRQSSAV